jgi:hypothetical protein
MPEERSSTPRNEAGVTGKADHIEIDWPRSIGFFGALGVAAALELVPLPIAVFVAAVPFLKLLNRPNASLPQTFVGHLVDGASKPVGGDAEGTVRWSSKEMRDMRSRRSRPRSRSSSQSRGGRR